MSIIRPWVELNRGVVAGALANVKQKNVPVPLVGLNTTFLAVLEVYTAGNIDLFLRFGPTYAASDVSVLGIDFANLAAADASDVRSVVFAAGAIAPDIVGSPGSIIPPAVTVRATSPGGTDLEYAIYYASVGQDS